MSIALAFTRNCKVHSSGPWDLNVYPSYHTAPIKRHTQSAVPICETRDSRRELEFDKGTESSEHALLSLFVQNFQASAGLSKSSGGNLDLVSFFRGKFLKS